MGWEGTKPGLRHGCRNVNAGDSILQDTTARHPNTFGSSTTFNPTSAARATVLPNACPEHESSAPPSRFPAQLKARLDFGQQPPLIRHFMDHHKGQGEIGLGIDTKAILLALIKSNSI